MKNVTSVAFRAGSPAPDEVATGDGFFNFLKKCFPGPASRRNNAMARWLSAKVFQEPSVRRLVVSAEDGFRYQEKGYHGKNRDNLFYM